MTAFSNGLDKAFPTVENEDAIEIDPGLTKREYFAGLAMQGMLAEHSLKATEEEFANQSVKLADALLKALEKDM
jgi:hypothetical protein